MRADEKHRLEAIRGLLGPPRAHEFAVGSGLLRVLLGAAEADDCAVLDVEGTASLVWGSDYVRGTGFKLFELGVLSYYDLGWYLVAANLSDVAAMGATPLGVLTVIRYPEELSDQDFLRIVEGARDAAAFHGCDVLGGDIGGATELVLSASALGVCPRGSQIPRSGARAGDAVCLTGPVGAPAAALLYFSERRTFQQPLSTEHEAELLQAWRRVEARTAHGAVLAREQLATACQDVSDGLHTTVQELAHASSVRIELDEDAIPIAESARRVAALLRVDALALAMSASVDFELLFSVAPGDVARCRSALDAEGLAMYEIGQAVDGRGATLRAGGNHVELPGVGWRHQEDDVANLLRDGLGSVTSPLRADSEPPDAKS